MGSLARTTAVATASVALGIAVGVWWARPRRRRLPTPSSCPAEGVEYVEELQAEGRPKAWLFFGNHFMDIEFFNSKVIGMATDKPIPPCQYSYPVRLRKSAGFMRVFGVAGTGIGSVIGDQTISAMAVAPEDHATDVLGVLVPLTVSADEISAFKKFRAAVSFEHFDWLGWAERPTAIGEVLVLPVFELESLCRPSIECPILQSSLDQIVNTALRFGTDFAAEWLDCTQWWEAADGVAFLLNDREHARRPWVSLPNAREIDRLLDEHPPCRILSYRTYADALALHLDQPEL
eukprot:6479793-Prymnesium_polylepis.1